MKRVARSLGLEEDLPEIDAASGAARFYNKSSAAVIKATTPFFQIG